MRKHIVHSYDRKLDLIASQVVEMGQQVSELLQMAGKALETRDKVLVEEAKAMDKKVNAFDVQIEQEATAVIALRQPMAIDLRLSVSALKIAVIMERMGDLAKGAVKRAVRITDPVAETSLHHVSQMVTIIGAMLEEVLVAFQQKDEAKAQEVVMRDGEVDLIYRQVMQDIQAEMIANPAAIPSYMQYIFAIKNIERIGDYVTKTAKIVHYIVTGERAPKNLKQGIRD